MTNRKTLSEHMRNAVKARWARTTKKERSAYATMMVTKREEKRAAAKAAELATRKRSASISDK